jgi:hypothetical protein
MDPVWVRFLVVDHIFKLKKVPTICIPLDEDRLLMVVLHNELGFRSHVPLQLKRNLCTFYLPLAYGAIGDV